MTQAFVLSGGASLGAVEVGMLQALSRAGVVPNLLVGTSVGALNAGWVAGRPDAAGVDALAEVWRGLRRDDVFPFQPLRGLLGFAGRRQSLLDASGVRRLLSKHLTFERLEDAPVPLHVVAVDVLSGQDVLLSRGDAVEAITASAAIPGIFPPVEFDGTALMDGGAVNNAPISHAVALGADTVWVLPAGYACALPEPPRAALAMALHGLSVLMQHRLALDVERYESEVDLRVVPPLCPVTISPADFRHSADLIERARRSTEAWLESRPVGREHQAALVAPHDH
ncbi:MAG: patatin-like phospholipase family protein [Actinobacteria bacterium]|nr:patatin-like phospholipase family protein [Actinomycetota bacterium]